MYHRLFTGPPKWRGGIEIGVLHECPRAGVPRRTRRARLARWPAEDPAVGRASRCITLISLDLAPVWQASATRPPWRSAEVSDVQRCSTARRLRERIMRCRALFLPGRTPAFARLAPDHSAIFRILRLLTWWSLLRMQGLPILCGPWGCHLVATLRNYQGSPGIAAARGHDR